jgi:hypothetical protein
MTLVELEQRVIDYLRSASIHAQAQARAHTPRHLHYGTAVSATAAASPHCKREREPRRWAAPRTCRRTHCVATALRRKEDDEMQRMDQLEQV